MDGGGDVSGRCVDCVEEGRTSYHDELFEDPRRPPLDEGECLCADHRRDAVAECLAEAGDDYEHLLREAGGVLRAGDLRAEVDRVRAVLDDVVLDACGVRDGSFSWVPCRPPSVGRQPATGVGVSARKTAYGMSYFPLHLRLGTDVLRMLGVSERDDDRVLVEQGRGDVAGWLRLSRSSDRRGYACRPTGPNSQSRVLRVFRVKYAEAQPVHEAEHYVDGEVVYVRLPRWRRHEERRA